MKIILSLLLLLLALFANAHHKITTQHDGVIIKNPWIRSAPANAKMLAGFVTITNNTNQDIKLIDASAHGFAKVELHKTSNKDNMMMMQKHQFVNIAAHKTVEFKPGSWHMMLIKPKQVPQINEEVDVILTFNNNTSQTIKAKVLKSNKMTMNHKNHN